MTTKNPHAVALGKLGGAVSSERKTAANRQKALGHGRPKSRYCEPCETWYGWRVKECPVCGAETVKAR